MPNRTEANVVWDFIYQAFVFDNIVDWIILRTQLSHHSWLKRNNASINTEA